MRKLTPIQEIILQQLESELREQVFEKCKNGLSSGDYTKEARFFVSWLVKEYFKGR